ncbi:bifunctional aldolase/short-chain dehydrogenase [Alicyclobacillus tolerans]|uniref:Rhamnulose-1-phosphate aldolase/alcohol dehydrogenase n=1 Tax=Alicyclobacillus tolerans TaxID=90970 RepID=A0ABT9LT97_9BACL|nr:bifunctional aldolase/short-chain dehydrogenase [Alicyclobacillus tengchongensis]MDP9727473.1 rhamnulose-1-phosphate aldolase/alcohol dehydrogenase [Alicyclobacillus tengchongensis]
MQITEAKKHTLAQLVERSNQLGADRSVCNWGGGNTSMKSKEIDFRGKLVDVLWVKGSGSDLAEATDQNFTALRLEDILPLMDRENMTDEEMVDYLSHCMMDSRHPRSSIETLLHAFLPFTHIDHTHPDSIISLCCTDHGRVIAEQIFGERMVWVPYIRPGFELSKKIALAVQANPSCELVLMEKHGLITWGETSEICYQHTLSVIQEVRDYIAKRIHPEKVFGGQRYTPLAAEERMQIAVKILPIIRGIVSEYQRVILTFDDSPDFLEFVGSHVGPALSQVGAACPDHLVHTKRVPLFIDWNPQCENVEHLIQKLKAGLADYKENYQVYFEKNKNFGDTMHDPYPRVILIPGIGAIGTGKNKKMSSIALALYHRAVAVMKGATTLGEFVSLNEKESFNVEYWPLELYKLSLAPPELDMARKVAFVTGGAGGIGSSTCRRFVQAGGHVVVADLAFENAQKLAAELVETHGEGVATAVALDVTQEEKVQQAMEQAILEYGGIDLLVSNAGLASSAPISETSLTEWNKNVAVLGTGYFLAARAAFTVMQEQGIGGNMVFITSKNAVYAGANAAAYSAAKAMESHLARCLAVEGGPYGIRVNSVMPDAVLQGSAIWNSQWREERARTYGIEPHQLEDYYRRRTLLKVNVFPDDIAEAILFFASEKSAKTTGCSLTVDGGVAAAFTR